VFPIFLVSLAEGFRPRRISFAFSLFFFDSPALWAEDNSGALQTFENRMRPTDLFSDGF
jgi:hypothetical protein